MSAAAMSDSECADDSSDCSNKFWQRPEQSPEATVNDSSESLGTKAFGGVLKKKNGLDDDRGISKRRQTKMLLVSLIESFCRVHGDHPESNRRVFFLICQTLSSLGFIDSEFVDEMAGVRSTFQSAFQTLFYTAVETVNDPSFRKPMMIAASEDALRPHQDDNPVFDLNIQNSRYRNDFVQVNLLGRGGFASVWRAHNKLDNIDYAVKQIRLGPDLTDDDRCDDGHGPYDKIFREVKHLAHLEHKNVVRYYSSWLEYTTSHPADTRWRDSKPSSQEEDYGDEDDDVFHGQDPTFDDDDNEPSFSPAPLSVEDMSHIHFVDDDAVTKGASSSAPAIGYMPSDSTNSNKDTAVCIPNVGSKRSARKARERRLRRRSRTKSNSNCGWTLYIQMYLCPGIYLLDKHCSQHLTYFRTIATLHDYIKHRNDTSPARVNKERNIEIFTQILEGTAYIHSQGLIHRDLKPSNIFLAMPMNSDYISNGGHRRSVSTSTERNYHHHHHSFSYDSVLKENGALRDCMWDEVYPKIGDFGLAAVMPTHCNEVPFSTSSPAVTDHLSFMGSHGGSGHSLMSLSSSYCRRESDDSSSEEEASPCTRLHKLTSAVGTRTYAAPEQLAVPPQAYDEKVDIYSLGIIFFELYQPFTTVMERACAIGRLKKGVFPEGFVENYPKESALILWMMDDNPAHRPTAMQLLEFELFLPQTPAEESMYTNLQAQLQAKSVALDTKDKEMAALRDKMEQIEQKNRRDMDAMQRRVDELQRQLSLAQLSGHRSPECIPSPTVTSSSSSSSLSKALEHTPL
ncbi:kinase-like domain-containing protein [Fennellomyces sp. T-0311]|nr:kinase-like domain-containing protein [Fennellomyces sp. T-0311]